MGARRSTRRAAIAVTAVVTLAAGRAGSAEPIASGDPRIGEQLFTGTMRLANGGAPCLGCHGVAGHGLARAASFGPDLTPASRAEADGIGDLLESMPFPSMEPVYRGHLPTPDERRHLVAFLREASGQKAPRLGPGYWLAVAAVAAAFGLATSLAGRRRARRSSGRTDLGSPT